MGDKHAHVRKEFLERPIQIWEMSATNFKLYSWELY